MSKRGVKNPKTGITDAMLRAKISSAMRKTWQATSRSAFIKSVRVPYVGSGRYKFGLICVECDKMYGLSEKMEITTKAGKKKLTSAIQIDHISENASLRDISNVGEYCLTLFFGEQQVMCYPCHKEKTRIQTDERTKRRREEKRLSDSKNQPSLFQE